MSVTFDIEQHEGDFIGTDIVRYDWDNQVDVVIESFDRFDYESAEALANAVWDAYQRIDDETPGGFYFNDYSLNNRRVTDTLAYESVNVSNANAVAIFRAAGLDRFLANGFICGTIAPSELRNALTLLTAIPDTGSDTIVERGEGGAVMYDCGRREGYLNERAAAIIAVCDAAESVGRNVAFA